MHSFEKIDFVCRANVGSNGIKYGIEQKEGKGQHQEKWKDSFTWRKLKQRIHIWSWTGYLGHTDGTPRKDAEATPDLFHSYLCQAELYAGVEKGSLRCMPASALI